MTDDEAVATASIGLQLYVEVPKDPRYKSEVLVQRGAESVAQEKVPVRLVAGRWDLLLLFPFTFLQARHALPSCLGCQVKRQGGRSRYVKKF